jgi:hypothetical protein
MLAMQLSCMLLMIILSQIISLECVSFFLEKDCGKELEHKKLCSSNSANNIKRNDTTKFAMVLAFLHDTYIEIMTELPKVTQEHGVTMKDVVLQFHFFSTATNPGPATIGEFA